jgi:hypothetical protein
MDQQRFIAVLSEVDAVGEAEYQEAVRLHGAGGRKP